MEFDCIFTSLDGLNVSYFLFKTVNGMELGAIIFQCKIFTLFQFRIQNFRTYPEFSRLFLILMEKKNYIYIYNIYIFRN